MSPAVTVAASAAILFLLGVLHLKLTYVGRKLWPREDSTRAAMQDSTLRITDEVDMWRAWISFNASHSLGAMLFGALYAYLALAQESLLRHSSFLQVVGMLTLLAYSWLGYRYWFSIPRRSIWVATACYAVGMVLFRV